jgi:hypothetical protein
VKFRCKFGKELQKNQVTDALKGQATFFLVVDALKGQCA